VGGGDPGRRIVQRPVGRRVLHQHAKYPWAEFEGFPGSDDDVQAERLTARSHQLDVLRVAIVRDQKGPAFDGAGGRLGRFEAMAHHHRLGAGRRLVQQRRVRHRETRQLAHHRLEVEQPLEAPLRDLRLVRRVLGVPTGFSRMFR
jgi:hypothetical protein